MIFRDNYNYPQQVGRSSNNNKIKEKHKKTVEFMGYLYYIIQIRLA